MGKDVIKKRKQDLGIFYTPQEVVDFIYDILNIWKNKEDKETRRWQTRKPKAHYPSVIDPACGEGVFLKTAITSGFTGYHPTEKTPYVFGVDLDGDVVKRWEEISILHDLFKGNKEKMLDHFHQQDGLLKLPDKVFNYKTGGLKEFDAVVGNPPYGGMGFSSLKEKSTKESIEILEHLRKYEVLVYKKKKSPEKNQDGLFGTLMLGTTLLGGGNSLPSVKEVESLPIEILFVDRFIQLAKPGGWVAVIIPDGILTNSNAHYVRDFISNRTKIEAIVSLPRDTFKNVGTNAKTSILFLRKLKKDEKTENSYPVFLSSINRIRKDQFDSIVKSYEKIYNSRSNHMDNSNKIQITPDQNKNESIMVRIDKTLKVLTEEKPQSRWDVKYWHPKYDYIAHLPFKTNLLKKYLMNNVVISADTVRASRGESYTKEKNATHPHRYYSVEGIWDTGYNVNQKEYGSENAYRRLRRSELKDYDIAIARSGTGSLGKSFIFIGMESPNIVSDLYIVRCNKKLINPFYIFVLLKTKLGEDQIERNEKGVSGQTKLTSDMIEYFLVPEISISIQNNIESKYRKILKIHLEALQVKDKGDNALFNQKINIANKLLRDLVNKTEEVIQGKREDVN